jgi:hypothetical protein
MTTISLFVGIIRRLSHGKRRMIRLLEFNELGAHLQPLVCVFSPRRSDV